MRNMALFDVTLNGRSALDNNRSISGRLAGSKMEARVLPIERWYGKEAMLYKGGVTLSIFEMNTTDTPTLDNVQREAQTLGLRVEKVDMGYLPHLKQYGARKIETTFEPRKFYDIFGMGEKEDGCKVVAGFMRVGTVTGREVCLSLEEARYLAGADLGLTPIEMRGVEAATNTAVVGIRGKEQGAVAFAYSPTDNPLVKPFLSVVLLDAIDYIKNIDGNGMVTQSVAPEIIRKHIGRQTRSDRLTQSIR